MRTGVISQSWHTLMRNLRINPGAVARQLLANLKAHKPLTSDEEIRVIFAIENAGVDVDRMLAHLSRNTIKELLNNS